VWKSDGTAAGTVLVKDINPGSVGSYPGDFINVNGTVYLRAFEGIHGFELWQTDGTAEGTLLVADIWPGEYGSYPIALTNINGTLFFNADDGIHGRELFEPVTQSPGNGLASANIGFPSLSAGDLNVVRPVSNLFNLLGDVDTTRCRSQFRSQSTAW